MQSRETPNYGKITEEECLEITKKHRDTVLKIMNIFYDKLLESGREHDKDKENPENLTLYTRSLNNPGEKETKEAWKKIHNHNNAHHVEGFLECDNPKLQDLVEMVCDNVATAIARDAKYDDIFEENKKRYMQKGLPENLAIICTNTFVDLRELYKEINKNVRFNINS